MGRLAGKVALITGAARGQGAAAARRFAEEGASVLLADINDEEGKALAEELGDKTAYHHLDVSDEDEWASAVEHAVSEFGTLNVLLNNAGVLHFSELGSTKLADYERVIKINQVGAFLGMRSVVEPMTTAGGGSVINVSSVEGLAGMPFLVAYTASKFAIRGMTKVAALELGDRGIRVNSLHPGMIDTSMVSDAAGGAEVDYSRIVRRLALGRVGQPEEIASLALFLASDESSYCTGAEFVADGGATATHALKL
ncbi:3-alpha-hydroxysteroid dehydrogenase [Prauserella marina]|uniref:3alpha(Or 20beta)-hydroxysteroid dehydrogenase n=1 Tax=Prauserella marina TaxID=530584 RepID=A0A222VU98_9PSEU|nr:glucose 1-dehydrogenase [Prauserella marina]ASR37460.1 3-alpha-hydroxysteroid dehydrogenase [Prauserella marina]PWV74651.1 3alpha(or 20beta)-hydroxysteroid dehydrogenase [Prauserella marina]SDD44272.1 3alpha(or 20beta)-hydroxysteroid dehydrogenase [Prauserella marina]